MVLADYYDLIIPELTVGPWHEAFGYAGEKGACGLRMPERALPNDDVSVAPFGRMDVERVIAMDVEHGDYAETDCLIVGELRDRRYFCLSASCDTTGWD